MKPALHPGIHSSEIDTGAWMYAIRRLPANITQVYLFMITTQVPATFLHPDLNLRKIVTAGRRRLIFALSPGKNLVLIREVGYNSVIPQQWCLISPVLVSRMKATSWIFSLVCAFMLLKPKSCGED